jgi:hypothetical protein
LDGDLDQELLDVIIDTEIGQIETNCQSLLIRLDQEGKILMIRASRGDYVRIKGEMYAVSNTDEVTEYDFDV